MSAACAPSEVLAVCRDLYSFDAAETERVVELCHELDQGWQEGQHLGYPGEPPPPPKKPGDNPGEPPEPEEFIGTTGGPIALAEDVVALLDDVDAALGLVEINPDGALRLPDLLDEIGLRPLDIWPEAQQDALARALASRDVRYLPVYFEPLLLRYGLQQAFYNLIDPAAMAEAHDPEV